jgi:ABC-2 type transport system permease protein
MIRSQLYRAWVIALKDMRIYYLKAPMISWGFLFPLVMILAFYLRDPRDIRSVAPGLIAMTMLFSSTSMQAVVVSFEKRIGAMERLLMAPLSPATLLIGKASSGVVFGVATGLVVWLLSWAAWGIPLHPGVLLSLIHI